METKEIREISYENWLLSAQKWVETLERTQKKERFLTTDGFYRLRIVVPCGYCKEFLPCRCGCPLSSEANSGEISICFRLFGGTHFWYFVNEMKKIDSDFRKAEYHCKVILGAIWEDCPDRARATKDGIVFNF
ncbi:MAG: hypothetical protein KAJ58_02780 [Candidatus Pacebacteria bacterium]|nr:hypothetical protein [Candidatus Paceibacterota bacterium]